MTHFPLNTAALCQDCSEVGETAYGVALRRAHRRVTISKAAGTVRHHGQG